MYINNHNSKQQPRSTHPIARVSPTYTHAHTDAGGGGSDERVEDVTAAVFRSRNLILITYSRPF